LVKTLQFIAGTRVSINFYRKGRKVTAKKGFSLFAFLCVILVYFAVKKNKNFIFYKTYGFLIHNGLVSEFWDLRPGTWAFKK